MRVSPFTLQFRFVEKPTWLPNPKLEIGSRFPIGSLRGERMYAPGEGMYVHNFCSSSWHLISVGANCSPSLSSSSKARFFSSESGKKAFKVLFREPLSALLIPNQAYVPRGQPRQSNSALGSLGHCRRRIVRTLALLGHEAVRAPSPGLLLRDFHRLAWRIFAQPAIAKYLS